MSIPPNANWLSQQEANKPEAPRTLASKLLAIMSELDRVSKNGWNEHGKYNYVMEADVEDAFRKLLIKYRVITLPNLVSLEVKDPTGDSKQRMTTIVMDCTFEDVDTGEKRTIRMPGQGSDALDKGVFKAITGCNKYMTLKTFHQPTGDDPENDGDHTKLEQVYEAGKKEAKAEANWQKREGEGMEKLLKESIAQVKPKINQAPVEKAKPEPSREVGEVITGTIVELIQDKFRGIKLQRVGERYPIKIAMWDNVQFPDKTRLYDYIKVGVAGAFECYVEKKGKFTNYKLIRPIHIGKTAFDDDGIPVIQRGTEVYTTDINDLLSEADIPF